MLPLNNSFSSLHSITPFILFPSSMCPTNKCGDISSLYHLIHLYLLQVHFYYIQFVIYDRYDVIIFDAIQYFFHYIVIIYYTTSMSNIMCYIWHCFPLPFPLTYVFVFVSIFVFVSEFVFIELYAIVHVINKYISYLRRPLQWIIT